MEASTDRIEKKVVLRAPRSKVWRAIADSQEFGSWFGVVLQGEFRPGATVQGRSTYPGYEHVTFELSVGRVEPERLLEIRWHPYAVDMEKDYSNEPTTLVAFELEEVPEGTRLTITESGFDRIPLERRAEAFRMNSQGWEGQLGNIARYVGDAG